MPQHPKIGSGPIQDPVTFVEEQQYAVVSLKDGTVVGPITLAFPGYSRLLTLDGLKIPMS